MRHWAWSHDQVVYRCLSNSMFHDTMEPLHLVYQMLEIPACWMLLNSSSPNKPPLEILDLDHLNLILMTQQIRSDIWLIGLWAPSAWNGRRISTYKHPMGFWVRFGPQQPKLVEEVTLWIVCSASVYFVDACHCTLAFFIISITGSIIYRRPSYSWNISLWGINTQKNPKKHTHMWCFISPTIDEICNIPCASKAVQVCSGRAHMSWTWSHAVVFVVVSMLETAAIFVNW